MNKDPSFHPVLMLSMSMSISAVANVNDPYFVFLAIFLSAAIEATPLSRAITSRRSWPTSSAYNYSLAPLSPLFLPYSLIPLHGDTSGWRKPPIDIDLKVAFYFKVCILKHNF